MRCTTCNIDKEPDQFREGRLVCKSCVNEYDKERKKKNRLKVKLETFKNCEICNSNKCLNDLSKVPNKIICKICYPQYVKDSKKKRHDEKYAEYYQKNKEKIIAKSLKWNALNKDKVAISKKTYRANHKDEINFRIKENLSTKLRQLVKKNGEVLIDFLDCSIDFLKMWFEYNFDDNMNWDNYGTYWQIDHVIPCASFDFNNDVETKICWNWGNLVPMEGKENASKASKIVTHYIDEINNRKIQFLNQFNEEESSETKRFPVELK
jgi:hypothetical protein